MVKQFRFAFLILLLCGSTNLAQSPYFPPGSLDDSPRLDHFCSDWYSKQLKALDEPSLWSRSKTQKEQSYRLLWLRTFHYPIVIRIDVSADGTSRLTVKMTDGTGGYAPGHLVLNDTSTLTREQTGWFLGEIEENNFWKLAAIDQSRMGLDGAQWIIEAVKNGSYHIVDRWSPKHGPVRAIALLMLHKLAKMKVPGPTY